jgi:CubicO group peptidase (beta-lactamase class C family)
MFTPSRHLSALLAAAALAAFPLTAADPDARIQRVEQGLRPGIIIKGQPRPRWSLAERMAFYKVPGVSVAVIVDGRIEWARGYGVVAAAGRPVDPQTLFQAASISKPVASMLALRLVDTDKLSLDEDVNVKLRTWKVPANEFTAVQKVTLRRLLNHSAGLTVHGFGGYASGEPVPTLLELLDGKPPANSKPTRVDIAPGKEMRYSGGGYEVMQQLVMDVTGKPFPQLAQEFVLGPLGMTRSAYRQPLPEGAEPNAAAGHRGDGSMIKGLWHTYPEMAAAGLWTTPSDLSRFAIELQKGGHVLAPATQREMLTPLLGEYGLGLGLGETDGRKWFSHGGANEGFRCLMFAYIDGAGAVIMTNSDRGSGLADEVMRAISAEYGWADYKIKERAVVAVDPDVLQSYAGRYALTPKDIITITVQKGRLFAEAPGEGILELFPESPSAFFSTEAGVPPIKFTRAADNSIEMSAGGAAAKRQPLTMGPRQ